MENAHVALENIVNCVYYGYCYYCKIIFVFILCNMYSY